MLRIKELRLGKNESQTDLAESVGVSLRTIQKYEAEKGSIPFDKLKKIAQHYDVFVSELFKDRKPLNVETDEALQEPGKKYDEEVTLLSLKKDLKTIYDGLTTNFNTISEGVFHILQDTQEIKHFINELDTKAINNASQGLNKFLEEHK